MDLYSAFRSEDTEALNAAQEGQANAVMKQRLPALNNECGHQGIVRGQL